ncbi:MAG: lytic transglycosylase domain-containing protein [Candidatus Binataceae bacterium]
MPGKDRSSLSVWLALSALALALVAIGPRRAHAGASVPFPCPASLEPSVQFWVNAFANYTARDFVVHDRDQVSRVYEVMHLPGDGLPSRGEADAVNSYLKTKYATILNRLATGAQPADEEEQRVASLFKGQPLSAYKLAADNLRVQEGMREQFKQGLLRSRYYRPDMERIFTSFGLPPELVTLAEVESGFYSRARSNAGAVGIWQFTRGTGHQYMRITRYHDDRLNPITETRAAAQLLRANYDELGSWPLAITAYDYGTAGMAHAASLYDSDYSRILRDYDGPHFGFAAKNYYAEFLAALQVHQHEDKYFPDLKYLEAPPPPPIRTDFPHPHLVRRFHHFRHRYRHHLARHHHRRGRVIRVSASAAESPAQRGHSTTQGALAKTAHHPAHHRELAHRYRHRRARRIVTKHHYQRHHHDAIVADRDSGITPEIST